jgi:hypothetical protein
MVTIPLSKVIEWLLKYYIKGVMHVSEIMIFIHDSICLIFIVSFVQLLLVDVNGENTVLFRAENEQHCVIN